ncbi:MAG TPA: hypothetical protein V6D07_07625 [Trichocoleus sp.]
MKLPLELLLTPDDIRYLKPAQLARLTRIDARYFSAWSTSRSISEKSLELIAQALGLTKSEVLQGFDLRREDAALAQAAQVKASKLISYLNGQRESA